MIYRRKDAYHRRAHAEGYRARSAYKLVELDRRFGLLSRGDYVVDLGAWPGGWLQVVLARVGPDGRVVGVDVTPIRPLSAPNVELLVADVRDPATSEMIRQRLGRAADVLLSDLAPKLTGIRATDEARCAELAATTLALVPSLLRPGGRFLMKTFMAPGYAEVVAELERRFDQVKATRPEATRKGSAELYLVGLGHRGPGVRS